MLPNTYISPAAARVAAAACRRYLPTSTHNEAAILNRLIDNFLQLASQDLPEEN